MQDPAAIEAMITVFKNRPSSLIEAIRVIGQMPGQEATDALLRQAMLTKNEDVGLAACEQLKTRSMYGYVPKLLAALSTPIETKFEVLRDGEGVRFRETIQREGQDASVVKTVDTEVGLLTPNPYLGNIVGQAYREALLDTQQTIRTTARLNRKLLDFNKAIYRVLEHTVGNVAPYDPESWWKWWYNYTVVSTDKKPAYVDNYYNPVTVPYVASMPYDIPNYAVAPAVITPPPPPPPPVVTVLPPGWHWDVGKKACFARGPRFGLRPDPSRSRTSKSATAFCRKTRCRANSPSSRSSTRRRVIKSFSPSTSRESSWSSRPDTFFGSQAPAGG